MFALVIAMLGMILYGIFVVNPTVDCAKPENVQVCSALSSLAIETTLYEDENGTLTLVTRDLGVSEEK